MKLKCLDGYCCGGGAGDGQEAAGFEVTGVDREEQPENPRLVLVTSFLDLTVEFLQRFDLIWASPPCQLFTAYKRRPNHVKDALNLIPDTRELLIASRRPYIIENVEQARSELRNPIMLCGSMFGLQVRRHRLFECSFSVPPPPPCAHPKEARFPGATNRGKNSRATVEVGVYRIPLETQRRAMGVTRPVSLGKLSQMVPPAYAEWLCLQARAHIMTQRKAA